MLCRDYLRRGCFKVTKRHSWDFLNCCLGDWRNLAAAYLAWSLRGPFSCGVVEGWGTTCVSHYHSGGQAAIPHWLRLPHSHLVLDWRAKEWSVVISFSIWTACWQWVWKMCSWFITDIASGISKSSHMSCINVIIRKKRQPDFWKIWITCSQ